MSNLWLMLCADPNNFQPKAAVLVSLLFSTVAIGLLSRGGVGRQLVVSSFMPFHHADHAMATLTCEDWLRPLESLLLKIRVPWVVTLTIKEGCWCRSNSVAR